MGKIFDFCHIVIIRFYKYCLELLNENDFLTSTVKVFLRITEFLNLGEKRNQFEKFSNPLGRKGMFFLLNSVFWDGKQLCAVSVVAFDVVI